MPGYLDSFYRSDTPECIQIVTNQFMTFDHHNFSEQWKLYARRTRKQNPKHILLIKENKAEENRPSSKKEYFDS